VLKPSTGTGDDHLAVGYHLARVAVSEVLVRVGDEVDHGVVKEEADQGSDSDRQQGDRKALAELRKVFEQCYAVQPVAVAVRGTRGRSRCLCWRDAAAAERSVVPSGRREPSHATTSREHRRDDGRQRDALLLGTMLARPVVHRHQRRADRASSQTRPP
jgi:hypothetical protein